MHALLWGSWSFSACRYSTEDKFYAAGEQPSEVLEIDRINFELRLISESVCWCRARVCAREREERQASNQWAGADALLLKVLWGWSRYSLSSRWCARIDVSVIVTCRTCASATLDSLYFLAPYGVVHFNNDWLIDWLIYPVTLTPQCCICTRAL